MVNSDEGESDSSVRVRISSFQHERLSLLLNVFTEKLVKLVPAGAKLTVQSVVSRSGVCNGATDGQWRCYLQGLQGVMVQSSASISDVVAG